MGPDRFDPGRAHQDTPLVRRSLDASLLVTLAVLTAAIVDGGGFRDVWLFLTVLVAGVDLALVTALRPDSVTSAMKRPVVLALLLLSAAGLASLLWNPLPANDVLPGALMPAALAALTVYGAAILRERRNIFLVWLAVVAVMVAISGLWGVAFKSEIWAKILGGTRRPAGMVEYSTALVLLQAGASVILLRLAGTGRPWQRIASASGLVLGLAAVVLAQNRLLGLATVLILAFCLMRPGLTLGISRRIAAILVLGSSGGGIVAAALLDRVGPGAGSFVFTVLLAVAIAAGLVLLAGRAQLRLANGTNGGGEHRRSLVIVAVLLVLIGTVALATEGSSRKGVQSNLGFTHGRTATWVDSVQTYLREPLIGHGQGTYLTATAIDLKAPSRYAHNLVVESAVELGLIGLIGAILLIGDSFRLAWQRRLSFEAFPLIPYFLLFTILLLTDWVWHMSAMSAIWALAAGSLLAVERRSVTE